MDNSIWTYIFAVTLLTLTPGVDTLMVIRNSLRGGVRDGLLTSFAICSGLFVHALVSAGGISFILMQSAWLFGVLKLAGAVYLVWLGLSSLLTAMQPGAGEVLPQIRGRVRLVSPIRSLKEGFLSNVLNPKAVVFYMAFLPQFIQPDDPAMLKATLLASIHFLIANIWQMLLVLAVTRASRSLMAPNTHRLLTGVSGSVLLFLGTRLALER